MRPQKAKTDNEQATNKPSLFSHPRGNSIEIEIDDFAEEKRQSQQNIDKVSFKQAASHKRQSEKVKTADIRNATSKNVTGQTKKLSVRNEGTIKKGEKRWQNQSEKPSIKQIYLKNVNGAQGKKKQETYQKEHENPLMSNSKELKIVSKQRKAPSPKQRNLFMENSSSFNFENLNSQQSPLFKKSIELKDRNLFLENQPLIQKVHEVQESEKRQTEQEKVKRIYDKVRDKSQEQVRPIHPHTLIEPEQHNKQRFQEQQIKIPAMVRNRIEDEAEYLKKITGRQQRPSQKNVGKIHQILSGKMSIIWIFVLSPQNSLDSQIKDRILAMYNALIDSDKVVPFITNPRKVKQYLDLPHCYFKIVTDLASAQIAIGYRIYSTVLEFHVWNEMGPEGFGKALEYKNLTRKTKGIFTEWEKVIDRAEDQIEEQISIYKVNNGLEALQKQRKFPNFLKLTDTDKTQATLYRINLYGSIKLREEQKKQSYKEFIKLVEDRYSSKQSQVENIRDYEKISHFVSISTLSQAAEIIKFYVRESFYYQVVNSMLRTMKTTEEFKPCILPFNETYQSIKLYYEQYLKELSDTVPKMTVYRGCKLKKKDFRMLKTGVFIEMFGFMSTSKDEERAKEFVDKDGYVFVIHVKERAMKSKFKNFDHGFVDINRYGLATEEYQKEEEVLFNSLNVYRVGSIEEVEGYTMIHLEYGVIFDLLEKPKEELTPDEYDTLINYHFCTKVQGKIEDQGDVFLFANELEEAKKYYDAKIKNKENLAHNHLKLANVQKECGEIDEAEKNAEKALELFGKEKDLSSRENCMKVFGIHSKNAEISLDKEDYLTADEDIDKALEMLSDDELFEKAVKLRERGEIKFKKGEVKQAEIDFSQSEQIFESLKSEAARRRSASYRKYYLSHLSLLCSDRTSDDLKVQLQQELNKIEEVEQKISEMNEDIEDELLKINRSLKDVSLYAEDRDKYEECVKKARGYLLSLQARKANDPEVKAKLLAMQAMVSDYESLARTETLMSEAVSLIESKNPYDARVAEYSKVLAKMQKAELEKFSNPGKNLMDKKPEERIPYDKEAQAAIYNRCKENFNKTIKVLMYHSKDSSSPEVLEIRNQLGDLSFNESDYSECEKIINEVKKSNQKTVHSEMAKSLLLMGRISFARGELKNCFISLDEAEKVLEEAMVGKHQKDKDGKPIQESQMRKYQNIYHKSDTLINIRFVKVTVYNKQKDHDLALKSIDEIEVSVKQKMDGYNSHPLLAQIYQTKGMIEILRGNVDEFDDFFEQSIELREKQYGYWHPVNAKAYCLFAKYLIAVKDRKKAEEMLSKGLQIISSFEETNPNFWAIYFTQGYYKECLEEYDEADDWYEKSLNFSRQYFDKSHITIKEIMLQYANSLSKSQSKLSQSVKIYEELQEELQVSIRDSNQRLEVQSEIDDEKISLKKRMYLQLSNFNEERLQQSQIDFNVLETDKGHTIDSKLYKSKLTMLRNTYKMYQNKSAKE